MLVTEGDENLLFLRDQVTYSHQISDMADENQKSWKNEGTDSAPDTKSTEQSDKNIKRCRYSRKGKEKVSLKDRQCIQKKVERKSWPELVITKVRGAKAYTKRLHVVAYFKWTDGKARRAWNASRARCRKILFFLRCSPRSWLALRARLVCASVGLKYATKVSLFYRLQRSVRRPLHQSLFVIVFSLMEWSVLILQSFFNGERFS